jgi:predicted RNA-binding Zn-ribbon protein involved in translation (DUF1610 family)
MSQSPPSRGTPAEDAAPLPSQAAVTASEHPCPECGEMVRSGMVRCYNCGAFLRKEIAQKYAEMQSKPPQIIFSELPEGAAQALGDVDDEGDDFELNLGSPTYALASPPESRPVEGAAAAQGRAEASPPPPRPPRRRSAPGSPQRTAGAAATTQGTRRQPPRWSADAWRLRHLLPLRLPHRGQGPAPRHDRSLPPLPRPLHRPHRPA